VIVGHDLAVLGDDEARAPLLLLVLLILVAGLAAPRSWPKNSKIAAPVAAGDSSDCDPGPMTMSVEVMETTEGIASSAISAKEGSARVAARGGRRLALCLGLWRQIVELATTIPKATAAAMSAENDRARLVDFTITNPFAPY
jgi:hypothetical protein